MKTTNNLQSIRNNRNSDLNRQNQSDRGTAPNSAKAAESPSKSQKSLPSQRPTTSDSNSPSAAQSRERAPTSRESGTRDSSAVHFPGAEVGNTASANKPAPSSEIENSKTPGIGSNANTEAQTFSGNQTSAASKPSTAPSGDKSTQDASLNTHATHNPGTAQESSANKDSSAVHFPGAEVGNTASANKPPPSSEIENSKTPGIANNANNEAETSSGNQTSATGKPSAALSDDKGSQNAPSNTNSTNTNAGSDQDKASANPGNGAFLNGDKANVAIVDKDWGHIQDNDGASAHGTIVKDVIETQLGKDGEALNIDEFDGRSGEIDNKGIFSSVLDQVNKTGAPYDYVNISMSNDSLLDFDADKKGRNGGLEFSVQLYNAQHGESGKTLGSYDDMSSGQRKELADFVQDYAAGNVELSDKASNLLQSNALVDQSVTLLGNSLRQGRELMSQGSKIMIAAGNHPNELNGLTLLREYNGESQGRAIGVGMLKGNVLQQDNVVAASRVDASRIDPNSATRGVDIYTNGHADFSHIQPHGGRASGSSIAAPELIAAAIKSQSRTDNLFFGKDISFAQQMRVIGFDSTDQVIR